MRANAPLSAEGVDVREHPIIVEFREGDVIPLHLTVEGDLVAAPADAVLPLTAKRPFFMRIDDKGMKISLDGTFEDKPRVPGSFAFGVGVTREGARADIKIKTPSR